MMGDESKNMENSGERERYYRERSEIKVMNDCYCNIYYFKNGVFL